MRLVALSVVALSGCFSLPFYEEGGPGKNVPYFEKQAQVCTVTESGGFEGQWQDWAGSWKVLELKDRKAKLIAVDTEGRSTTEATGTYALESETLTVSWDDGKTETMDTQLEDTPGCVMLQMSNVKGDAPRLSQEQYFEKVSCTFNEEATAGVQK